MTSREKWHVGMKPGPMVYGPHGSWIANCDLAVNTDEENRRNALSIVSDHNNAFAHANLLKAAKKAVKTMNQLIAESDDPFDMPTSWLDDLEVAVWACEDEDVNRLELEART